MIHFIDITKAWYGDSQGHSNAAQKRRQSLIEGIIEHHGSIKTESGINVLENQLLSMSDKELKKRLNRMMKKKNKEIVEHGDGSFSVMSKDRFKKKV
jgi:regulator of replication initiation timing